VREWVRKWARNIVGEMELDVFASEGSRMCERYYSRWEMRGSVGVNVLWREWGERNWVVPPVRSNSLVHGYQLTFTFAFCVTS